MKNKIPVIVATGGPGGGKTSCLSMYQERLGNLGFKVFIVPEAATILINSGLDPAQPEFQENILKQVLFQEDLIFEAAEKYLHPKKVIICDRGAMDGAAYVGRDEFERIINSMSLSAVELRDKRYDAVIHLVTAADGAEAAYTTANNSARKESSDQARALDRATQNAWLGHPHLKVIKNRGLDFRAKKREVFRSTCRILGIPVPLEIERKFVVDRSFDLKSIPVPYEVINISQTYLSSGPHEEERVRERGQNGSYVYFHTIKENVSDGVRVERETMISRKDYRFFLKRRDPKLSEIKKKRICFIWDYQYFELDIFRSPGVKYPYLEIELTEENEKVNLPDFIKVKAEVTGQKEHSNHHLAKFW